MLSSLDKDGVQRAIWRAFTERGGLTVKADASEYLQEKLMGSQVQTTDLAAILESIVTGYKEQGKRKDSFLRIGTPWCAGGEGSDGASAGSDGGSAGR